MQRFLVGEHIRKGSKANLAEKRTKDAGKKKQTEDMHHWSVTGSQSTWLF